MTDLVNPLVGKLAQSLLNGPFPPISYHPHSVNGGLSPFLKFREALPLSLRVTGTSDQVSLLRESVHSSHTLLGAATANTGGNASLHGWGLL